MRLRNIPESYDYFANSPYAAAEPETLRGRWRAFFAGKTVSDPAEGLPAPTAPAASGKRLEAEFGCGKGRFITELSAADPKTDYIGIDKYTSVIYKGLRRIEGRQFLDNLRFCCVYASTLTEIFADGELDRIYLNFSDPWPKKRHADRRLTSRRYLAMYERILAPGGTIEFKTDNRGLFDFSLEELAAGGWTVLARTFDLHAYYAERGLAPEGISAEVSAAEDPAADHDIATAGTDLLTRVRIMTEYEEKFSGEGKPICKLIASKL